MRAERLLLAKNNFKRDTSIWQFLGLERTLLNELPHMPFLGFNIFSVSYAVFIANIRNKTIEYLSIS